jgi:hypothetical protein
VIGFVGALVEQVGTHVCDQNNFLNPILFVYTHYLPQF